MSELIIESHSSNKQGSFNGREFRYVRDSRDFCSQEMYFNVLFETIENNLSLFSYLFLFLVITNLIESTSKKVEKQNTPLKKYTIQFIKKTSTYVPARPKN